MIKLYCKRNHKDQFGICPDCQKLIDYACKRSDSCPFMETKTFCSNCKIHCYSPEMKGKIREVMRFSGPRMLVYHPLMAIRHVVESMREKKRLERKMISRKIIDAALVVLLVLLFVTGCLFGPFPQYYILLKCIHSLAAVLFLVCMVAHIMQHRIRKK